jgi:hypothetical protein
MLVQECSCHRVLRIAWWCPASYLPRISKGILWTLLVFLCSLMSSALCLCIRFCVLSESCVTSSDDSTLAIPAVQVFVFLKWMISQSSKCTQKPRTSACKSGNILTQFHWVQGINAVWPLVSTRMMITDNKLVGWLVGWLVYSYCSHLEHRASVKHFVSLQFLNLRHSVGLLGRVISPSQGHYLTQRINTDIHASSGIRTHDPSVRASEGSSYLRPRGKG